MKRTTGGVLGRMVKWGAIGTLVSMQAGCILTGNGIRFPEASSVDPLHERDFDSDGDGAVDFRFRTNEQGRFDLLCYDDDQDGADDRVYRLSDYAPENVPHLIILLDSIPYGAVAERAAASRWNWFDPPCKVIPPFPTMSGVIFTRLLHAPPLGGMINQYYNRERGAREDRIFARAGGDVNPWELRLHYRMKYWENGLAFLRPRACFQSETMRVKAALDASPDRVTIVYLASTAGMLSKHGAAGLSEVLDGVEQLCLRILHDRRGAVKLSIMADHGHNLIAGTRVDVAAFLKEAGFAVRDRLGYENDVVVELDGLVNYAGVHTRRPARVAEALTGRPEIELAMYQEGERVVVRSGGGRACIEYRNGRYRYTAMETDVLSYAPVLDKLRGEGKLDGDGFASDRDWFNATVDHRWPDAPRRLWDAFHGLAVNTPDVMITTTPGSFAGLASMEKFITMASTHGGLDDVDSNTFVLTMTGRAHGPMRTADVLPTIEPTFDPTFAPDLDLRRTPR